MERLKSMKNTLMSQIEAQMGNLQCVDTEELGQAIDMIKDLEEAIYYCTVVEAMGKEKENQMVPQNNNVYYYTESSSSGSQNGGNQGGGQNNGSANSSSSNSGGRSYYTERDMPVDWTMKDPREGQSPKYRRMYMESKQMHKPQDKQMADLERYLQELSSDITEIVEEATPEEKLTLRRKISSLAEKINV